MLWCPGRVEHPCILVGSSRLLDPEPPVTITIASAAALALALPGAGADGAPGGGYTSSDEVRAIVSEMLADAEMRTSLVDAPGGVGHDGRFFLTSADGNFRLQVGGDVQVRYYGNVGADSPTDDGSWEGGFVVQRSRLNFAGHVIDPRLTYRILIATDRSTGGIEMQEVYAEYAVTEEFKVRWGQFKLPFDREFSRTSSTALGTIERSLVSSIFRLDYSQGVQLEYEQDRWRIFGAMSDGRRAYNVDWTDTAVADIALTGRVEGRFGEAPWKQFNFQTSCRGDAFGVLLGAGGHWQQDGSTGAPSTSEGTPDLFSYTADLGVEGDGWNVLLLGMGQYIDSANTSLNDLGFVLQGGVFVTDQIEPFARAGYVVPSDNRTGGNDPFWTLTGGANWYFIPGSPAFKVSAEVTYYPDTQTDSASLVRAPNTSVGLLPDDSGGQAVFIVQVQIVF